MKIAIISDSHDNVKNLEKLIKWLNKNGIKILIHAGDLCAPSLLIKTLSPNFKGQIHIILGNVGDEVLLKKVTDSLSNVKYYGKSGELKIQDKKIALVHFKEGAEKLAAENKYDLVVYGHTHQPEIRKTNQTWLINPGTIGGLYNKATFAICDVDSGKIDIKELDNL